MIEVKVTGVPEDLPKALRFIAHVFPNTVAEFEQALAAVCVKPEPVKHDPAVVRLPVGDGAIHLHAPYEVADGPKPKSTPRTRFIDKYLGESGDES